MKVLMSFAMSPAVRHELLVDGVAGEERQHLAKISSLKYRFSCRKGRETEKKEKQALQYLFIYLFLANEVLCQALISDKEICLLPKHRANGGSLIHWPAVCSDVAC